MIKGKRAIVTGASRGIGFAIAKALAEHGIKVLITGRNQKTLDEAKSKIGDNAITFVWDVSDVESIESKFQEAVTMLGGVDILVNNAGIFCKRSEWSKDSLLETTVDEWRSVRQTNTDALFFCMQSAVKYMLKNKIEGNILNITSVAGYEPVKGAYGASKIASVGLTRGWGQMFAPDRITISGIAPGPVATEMNDWHEGDPLDYDRIPFGRFSTIEEIAELAVYMLDEKAKMLCGETIVFDGGYAIR